MGAGKTGSRLPHGTAGGYTNWKCKCRKCRLAWAKYHKIYMDNHPKQRQKAKSREKIRYSNKRRMIIVNKTTIGLSTQARFAAEKKLKTNHAQEFMRLEAEERTKLGLPAEKTGSNSTLLLRIAQLEGRLTEAGLSTN